MTFLEFFNKGGPLMYPIALCIFVELALIIERTYFFLEAMPPEKYIADVRDRLREADFEGALASLGERQGPIPNVLRRGVRHMAEFQFELGSRITDFERAMKEAIINEMKQIYRSIGGLATIAQVSPLFGLLGTVTGLLETFLVLAQVGRPDVSQLAAGIGVALITTVAGLVAAIPALIANSHFNGRAESVVMEMERISVEMANAIAAGRDAHAGGGEVIESMTE